MVVRSTAIDVAHSIRLAAVRTSPSILKERGAPSLS